jgi:hypothetical protein
LIACHHRIREHLVLGRRIASAPPTTPLDRIQAAAGRVHTYFGIAFPLHRADEEEDIFPLLIGRNDELDAAIGELVHDHDTHEAQVTRLVEICRTIEQDPAQARAHSAELDELVRALEAELVSHLALEERTMFPAIATLTEQERLDVLHHMRERRTP